ncbi:MAG: histidine triad nucleotide-binding protein [Parachlamydiaceae bacterium]
MSTVFSKILKGELPAEKVYENEHVLAFKDIHPKAPVHILIIPKKEIKDIQSVQANDYPLLVEIIRAAQAIAEEQDVADGYRLVTNSGPLAGQEVYHLHFHLLGGKKLGSIA